MEIDMRCLLLHSNYIFLAIIIFSFPSFAEWQQGTDKITLISTPVYFDNLDNRAKLSRIAFKKEQASLIITLSFKEYGVSSKLEEILLRKTIKFEKWGVMRDYLDITVPEQCPELVDTTLNEVNSFESIEPDKILEKMKSQGLAILTNSYNSHNVPAKQGA